MLPHEHNGHSVVWCGEMAAEMEFGLAASLGCAVVAVIWEMTAFCQAREGASEAREIEDGRVSGSISLKAPFIN